MNGGIGIANLPNQLHKIVCGKGSNFTILLVGESGLGKTTFINTLFTTTILQSKNLNNRFQQPQEKTVKIELTKASILLAIIYYNIFISY